MSLWAFSVRRWQFTLVVFALLIATGLWALSAIPRAEDPTLKFPGTLIVVNYPGADPEDVERLVVDPIEDALAELEDIKRLTSAICTMLTVPGVNCRMSTENTSAGSEGRTTLISRTTSSYLRSGSEP